MFLRLIIVSVSSFLILSCSSVPKDLPKNVEFESLVSSFFKDYWKTFPGQATAAGLVDYASTLELPDNKSREKKRSFYNQYLQRFKAIEDKVLSFSQRTDKALVLNSLNGGLWRLNEYKAYEWNPSIYNVGGSISSVLESEKISSQEKLEVLAKKFLEIPKYYQTAKSNITSPTKEHTKLALQQTKGLLKYLNGDVRSVIKKSKLSRREKSTLYQRLDASAEAARRYRVFLQGILARPKKFGGFRSFRIGKDLYAKKFQYDLQSEYSPEELYKLALSKKEDARSKMFEKAILLYPKYFGSKLPPKDRQEVMKSIVAKVSKKHTKPSEFVDTVRKQIPELTKFINDKKLLTLDPTRPLKVRETPLYQRGFAGASVDSPGPMDKTRETYYNVTPLDGMSKKEKESYLREYNDYTLQILNIHEAIPGHYVQLVYSNKSPSLIKSIFGNGPMIEGWAVYTERMMLEEGYGEDSPELWLMYYKWFLRVVTNTIIDYEIHNKDLSKKQAMKLMTEDAFQEKAEAEGKWRRATVSQVQLASYFSGFSEIYALRENLKKKKAEEFNLKEFHEKFLSFGSAPVKEIKKLMH